MSDEIVEEGGDGAETVDPENEVLDPMGGYSEPEDGGTGEVKAEKKKYKVKIDNEESEVDEDELLKGYQLSKASQRRMQQASDLQKELESFVKEVKQNPMSLLSKLGIDVKDLVKQSGLSHKEMLKVYGDDINELAASILQEQIEDAMMSPAEKKAREYDRLMAQREEEQKKQEEFQAKEAHQKAIQQAEIDIQNEMVAALQEHGIKPTREILAQLAYEMAMQMDRGIDVKASDIVKGSAAKKQVELAAFLKATDPSKLSEFLPEEVLKALNQQKLDKMTGQGQRPAQQQAPKQKRQYKTLKELGL